MEDLKKNLLILEEEVTGLREELRAFRREINVELLVGKVTNQIIQNFYIEVGKALIKKLLWIMGTVFVGLALWLIGTGKVNLRGPE